MDSRQRRRVRMRLPVRLRWTTPFGQKIELVETIDVSRSGLLVSTKEPHSPGMTAWATFPYDASLSDGQPEIPARVVRCDERNEVMHAANAGEKIETPRAPDGKRAAKSDQLARAPSITESPAAFAVAFRFEEQPHPSPNGSTPRHEPERRGSARTALAIPVRVRPEQIAWFEEAMTVNFSAKGMRFRSQREYGFGERLKIAFEVPASAPWHGASEFASEVVRVSSAPGGASLDVSVRRME
jgi:PilZ domain